MKNCKQIAWILPGLIKGSGGHRTIIQNINYLTKHNYCCDIYLYDTNEKDINVVLRLLNEWYEKINGNIYLTPNFDKHYDALVLTFNAFYKNALKFNADNYIYFVQDYEPYFYPVGDHYLTAYNSYIDKYNIITIGKWLSYKLNKEHGLESQYFNFCADSKIYKNEKIKKERAICFCYQPEKHRRAPSLMESVIKAISEYDNSIKIYLFGSETNNIQGSNIHHLGIINPKEINELYNKCLLGVSFSLTNPSRIPFEMMASGLPVVELFGEQNLYDLPSKCVCLAKPNLKSICSVILSLINDSNNLSKMSIEATTYIKDYSINVGYEQLVKCFERIIQKQQFNYKIPKKVNSSAIEIDINNLDFSQYEQIGSASTPDFLLNHYMNYSEKMSAENLDLNKKLEAQININEELSNNINRITTSKSYKLALKISKLARQLVFWRK